MTIIGAIAPHLTEKGSGITLTAAQIALAGSVYIAGACLGALLPAGRALRDYRRCRVA